MGQDKCCHAVQNGGWTLPCQHSKEAKLAAVMVGTGREAPSKEVDHWGWCARVEAQKSLQSDLVVVVKSFQLGFAKNKSSKSTEQYWKAI